MKAKTQKPCDCPVLQDSADSPDHPIQFDEKLGEYHIVYPCGDGLQGKLLIRHCFFCGGKAPASTRAAQFARISRAEKSRLLGLFGPLKTLADVVAAFGEPDLDLDHGFAVETPERDGQPGSFESFRELRYERLSDTAELSVTVYPDDRVRFGCRGSTWAPLPCATPIHHPMPWKPARLRPREPDRRSDLPRWGSVVA
jgi:hypothetical protein